MGFQVIKKPNSFCKDNCEYMDLESEVNKHTDHNGINKGFTYSAEVFVSCKNECICGMWNEE